MRAYFWRIVTLDSVCRLDGQWLSNGEIAAKLNRTGIKVRECISRMLHVFTLPNRMELAHVAIRTNPPLKQYR
jgi:hypothetical protein